MKTKMLGKWFEDAMAKDGELIEIKWEKNAENFSFVSAYGSASREDGFLILRDNAIIWVPETLAKKAGDVFNKMQSFFTLGQMKKYGIKIGTMVAEKAVFAVAGSATGAIMYIARKVIERKKTNRRNLLPPPREQIVIYPLPLMSSAKVEALILPEKDETYFTLLFDSIYKNQAEYGLREFGDWIYDYEATIDKNFFLIPETPNSLIFFEKLFGRIHKFSMYPSSSHFIVALRNIGGLPLGPVIFFDGNGYFFELRHQVEGPFKTISETLEALAHILPKILAELEKVFEDKNIAKRIEKAEKTTEKGDYIDAVEKWLELAGLFKALDFPGLSLHFIRVAIDCYLNEIDELKEKKEETKSSFCTALYYEQIAHLYNQWLNRSGRAIDSYYESINCYEHIIKNGTKSDQIAKALYRMNLDFMRIIGLSTDEDRDKIIIEAKNKHEKMLFLMKEKEVKKLKKEEFYKYAEIVLSALDKPAPSALSLIDQEKLEKEGWEEDILELSSFVKSYV